MNEHVRAYEGREPYIFVSYAHKDSDTVLPVVRQLHEMKYRIWYDEGIKPGSEWPDNIATHLEAASAVLLFLSQNFLDSVNCRNELKHAPATSETYLIIADDNAAQPLFDYAKAVGVTEPLIEKMRKAAAFHPDENLLPKLKSRIGREFIGDGITGYQYAIDKRRHFNAWNLMLGAAVFLAFILAAALYGLWDGWFDGLLPARQTAVENIARATQPPEAIGIDDTILGSVLPVPFPSEEEKNAVNQKLGWKQPDAMTYADLVEMAGLTQLEIGDGEPIYDLSFAAYLPDLEVIILHGAWIKDLAPLAECPKLKKVMVTADMLPLTLPSDRRFDVEILQLAVVASIR